MGEGAGGEEEVGGGVGFGRAGEGVGVGLGGVDDAGDLEAFEEVGGGFVGEHEEFGGFVGMEAFALREALVEEDAEGEDPVDVGDHGGAEAGEEEAASPGGGRALVEVGGLEAEEDGTRG